MAQPYLTIAGPIGTGKSTFAAYLSKQFGYPCFLESAGERNPFLEKFYAERKKYAFKSQAFFILEAIKQEKEIQSLTSGAIQDRSHWEHQAIFVKALLDEGSLSLAEYQLLSNIVDVAASDIPYPSLMIYLRATPKLLKERISSRGRDYEKTIKQNYLKHLIELYEEWVDHWRGELLIIEAGDIDYKQSEINDLLVEIKERLNHYVV